MTLLIPGSVLFAPFALLSWKTFPVIRTKRIGVGSSGVPEPLLPVGLTPLSERSVARVPVGWVGACAPSSGTVVPRLLGMALVEPYAVLLKALLVSGNKTSTSNCTVHRSPDSSIPEPFNKVILALLKLAEAASLPVKARLATHSVPEAVPAPPRVAMTELPITLILAGATPA